MEKRDIDLIWLAKLSWGQLLDMLTKSLTMIGGVSFPVGEAKKMI